VNNGVNIKSGIVNFSLFSCVLVEERFASRMFDGVLAHLNVFLEFPGIFQFCEGL